MLIKKILDADTVNCYEALKNDAQLKKTEDKVYSLLSGMPEDIRFDMERTISEYLARVTRIAYLQGMKDFAELYVILKLDVSDILAMLNEN